MAQLIFRFGTVNSGKSLELLKVAHNYEEQGKNVLTLTSSKDDRFGVGKITSRVGIDKKAKTLNNDTDILGLYKVKLKEIAEDNTIENKTISCVLVDEAQFLSKSNIKQLTKVVDLYGTPVIAYGLKVDFSNNLFEGSKELLIEADKIEEIKTICSNFSCEKKATMNIRMNNNGVALYEGEQIEIGGNERYVPVCRFHYYNFNE